MRTRCFGSLIAIVFAIAVGVVGIQPAQAQTDYYFVPAGVDDYNVDANWLEPNLMNQFVPSYGFDERAVIGGVDSVQSITYSGVSPGAITLARDSATTGTLEIRSGGVLHSRIGAATNGGISVGPHSSGVGTLRVLPGGTLTAEGSLTSGSTGNDQITVGGTDTGTATLSAASAVIGGMMQVYPNADVSTTGNFYFSSNATYQVEVNASGNGTIDVGENAGLDGSLHFNFTGVTPSVGDSWNVLEANQFFGSFRNVTYSVSLPYNQTFVTATTPAGGDRSQLTVDVEEVLVLNVNRDTGEVTMSHPGTTPIELDSYYIGSDAGTLVPANWSSFHDQGLLGGGWLETTTNPGNVGEVRPTGSATISGGSEYELGAIFDPFAGPFGSGSEDLELVFSRPSDGAVLHGVVQYTGTAVNNLLLQVDPATGQTYLRNPSQTTVQFDAYHVLSDSGSLSTDGWNSLDEQGAEGNIWEEVLDSDSGLIGEFNTAGFTTLAPGMSLNLGQLFNPAGTQDLEFEFLMMGEEVGRVGTIFYEAYVPPTGVDGDYNDDGIVDAADYTVWRDNLNTSTTLPHDPTPGTVDASDYTVWKTHFGQSAPGSGSGALSSSVAVPEPAAWLLVLLGGLAVVCRRRQVAAV
jgi:hypothetical protein